MDAKYKSDSEAPLATAANVSSASDSFTNVQRTQPPLAPEATRRDLRFWMCIVCMMIASFVVALDLTGISTALPVIIRDLKGKEFEWVGSAYALSATAFLPLSGGLAQIFGRRESMLLQIFLFALGSVLCGVATSLNFLIAGRTVQGIGAGGLTAMSQIIISDLVPLHERGIFNAFLALAYAFASSIAAPIAGTLAEHGQWRWFFYMNLPLCAVAAIITVIFVNLHVPRGSFRDKLFSLDWIGNLLVVGSTTAVILALTWGGIQFSWGSPRVLVPLIVGLVGLVAFVIYDAKVPRLPLVPFKVLASKEALSGYLQGFFTNFYMLGLFYYLPVYLQACRGVSPIRSGVLVLPTGIITMPAGIVAGLTVAKRGRYRVQLWIGWVLITVSAGLYCIMDADTSSAAVIGFQAVGAIGLGIALTCAVFPILAPIPLSLNPNALAFFMFMRFFSQTWGISVGGSILQNELKKRLPNEFISEFPEGTSVAFSIVPVIQGLEEPFRTQVRVAFADSLRVLWEVLIGIGALGLLSSFLMKGLSLRGSPGREADETAKSTEVDNAVQVTETTELGRLT
ncbi:hypothetical protein ACEPAH_4080 [Sanghuangporus vaninii]